MKTIGFIGLGTMGYAMAENLLSKGFEVVLHNRTKSRAEKLAAEYSAATVAGSPKEVAREADIVFTMLGDDASVESVYYSANGIFSGLRAGMTVIDCSTVSPSLSRRLSEEIEGHLSGFLDAPVTGSKPAAVDGTLLFIIGGREEMVESVRDILLAMGRSIIHMGPSGTGSQTKLAHNMMVGIHAAALSEGLALAVKSGVDPAKFLEAAGSGVAASKLLDLKRDKLLQGDFSNQFSVTFMLKDLRLAAALSDELGVPAPILSSTKDLFTIGESRGLGELDLSSIIQCYEEWSGVAIAGRATRPAREAQSVPGLPNAAAQGKSDDRRRTPRLPMNIPLHISVYQWEQEGSFSGQQIEATLSDLSESGLQVRSAFPLALDMFVVIHFPKEANLPPITGKIIRVVPDGDAFRYGCMLSGLPPFVRLALEDYLRSKAGKLSS